MKSAAVAIFVKTPGLSPIKTRLAYSTSQAFAEEFYLRSLNATKAVVCCATQKQPNLLPYWAIAEQAALEHLLWQDFARVWQGSGDLGVRLGCVYKELKHKHDFVILIGADSPLLTAEHLFETYSFLTTQSSLDDDLFVLGRARDGGFYLFGGGSDIPNEVWTSVQYSSTQTANQLKELLHLLGTTREIEELPDVDTLDDLLRLPHDPATHTKLLEAQRDLLHWIRQKHITSAAQHFEAVGEELPSDLLRASPLGLIRVSPPLK